MIFVKNGASNPKQLSGRVGKFRCVFDISKGAKYFREVTLTSGDGKFSCAFEISRVTKQFGGGGWGGGGGHSHQWDGKI